MKYVLKIRNQISRTRINIPGWHNKRKIIVIESDDWGSIRMPSIEIRDYLISKGVKFPLWMGFDNVDNLASEDDLTALFETLIKFKDHNGNYPVITANTIVTNPDFEKILNTGYSEYHYELFTKTLKRNYPHQNSFKLWQQGFTAKLFYPQFHGREHINVQMWLNSLKEKHKGVIECFELGVYSLNIDEDVRQHFMHAYNISRIEEQAFVKESIRDGMRIFENIFGYKSLSAIAPAYTWDYFVESEYASSGIKYIQGSPVQQSSVLENRKLIRHFTGDRNKLGQIYLVRNCIFEPSHSPIMDPVDYCLNQISNAFFWNKPAIISSHRYNYIGNLNIKNRKNSLFLLEKLLQQIIIRWPDSEFMTTSQLGELISIN